MSVPGSKRWEHRTRAVSAPPSDIQKALEQVLHEHEVLGWELVSTSRSQAGADQVGYRLFFKRQVEDDT